MTELLQKAFEEASKLSAEEQDAIAASLLEDLAAEATWDRTLAMPESSALLRDLAGEARNEYRSGKTKELDPDGL